MNLKMYFVMLALGVSAWTLQSCGNDDDSIAVSETLTRSLADRHPDAERVEWETDKGYFVADFYEAGKEKSAWFTPEGLWQLTETEIPFNALPDAVQTAFNGSTYANWHVEDVDMVERPDVETIYVIEVEQGEQEVDLFYTADGVLVKEVANTGGNGQGGSDYLPSEVPAAIQSFIDERYPNARVVETDREQNGYKVDIIHDGRAKEVVFDLNGTWIYTSWDLSLNEVPEIVKNAAQAQQPGYRLDDADYVETPDKAYYLIEMESGEREVKVKVAEDGNILA